MKLLYKLLCLSVCLHSAYLSFYVSVSLCMFVLKLCLSFFFESVLLFILCMSTYLYFCPYVCPTIYVSVFPFVWLTLFLAVPFSIKCLFLMSIHHCVYLSFCQTVPMNVCRSLLLSIYLSIYLLSVLLSNFTYVYLYFCLSIPQFKIVFAQSHEVYIY